MGQIRNTATERRCPTCEGTGSVTCNDTNPHGYGPDPQCDYDVTCPQAGCNDGWICWADADPLNLLKQVRQHARSSFGARRYEELRQRVMKPAKLPADLKTMSQLYAEFHEALTEHRRQLAVLRGVLGEVQQSIAA